MLQNKCITMHKFATTKQQMLDDARDNLEG